EDGQGEVVALEQRGLGPRREILRDGAPALGHLHGEARLLLAQEHDHHEHDGEDENSGDEQREFGLEGLTHFAPIHCPTARGMRSESLALRDCPTSLHFIAPPPASPPAPPAPPRPDHAPTPRDWAPRTSSSPHSPCGGSLRRRRGRARSPRPGAAD